MKECPEKPETLVNSGMGMYHCPTCGMMVLAGVPHPITDGTVCLACGAGKELDPDPDCPYCRKPFEL